MPDDTFRSIARPSKIEVKVDGSRFIGESFRTERKDLALEILDQVQSRERKASHHCLAYRIGVDGDTFYFDDDGEPSGTAGRPILRQINGRDLTNVLVVVTRYFGGTKLGTGGLVRAYGGAADQVLQKSGVKEHVIRFTVDVTFAYEDTSAVDQLIDQFDVEQYDATYTAETNLSLGIRASEKEKFEKAFVNQLGGRGKINFEDED